MVLRATPQSMRNYPEHAHECDVMITPVAERAEEGVREVVLGSFPTARADRAEPSPACGCFGAMAGRER
eukprot:1399335-Alexandrium_andersonii.AAC.1